jgi:4-amino-4-deoxy-L-arabinose transferase-like glycosyltransferase
MFGIGSLLDGRRTGLLAALLWACLPLDIFLASDLLPDAPVATLTAAAVFSFLRAERGNSNERFRWVVVSALCMLWAILIKPVAIITLMFLLVYVVIKAWPWFTSLPAIKNISGSISRFLLPVLGLSAVLLIGLSLIYSPPPHWPMIISLSRTATDFSREILTGETGSDYGIQRPGRIDLFAALGPLFLVSAVILLFKNHKHASLALTWSAFYILYYEWGSIGLDPRVYRPAIYLEERNFLFILIPFVILAAIYLADELKDLDAERVVIAVAALVSLIALILGQPLITGQYRIQTELLKITAAVAILISPLVFRSLAARHRRLAVGVILGLVCLALLKPSPPLDPGSWEARREVIQVYRPVADYLEQHDGNIYIDAYGQAMRLNYASDFELGFDWAEETQVDPSLRILIGSPALLSPGDYYVSSSDLVNPVENLQEVFRTGRAGKQLIIFYARTGND